LETCPRRGLLFKRNEKLKIEVYTDTNYAGSVTNRKSTARYYMFLGGNLVTWRSKKQNVARSSGETEF